MPQASEKVRRIIEAIKDLSPDEAASWLLAQNKGDPRAAEVDAWDLYDFVAGGMWGYRPKPPREGAIIASQIAQHIIGATEKPPVPRGPVMHPAYVASRTGEKPKIGSVLSGILGGKKKP